MLTRRNNRYVHSIRGRTHKAQGGKFIFAGTYGCTFRPAVRCVGDKVRRPGLVSKLMEASEADSEFKQRAMLVDVDPSQKYLLYPVSTCPPMVTKNPENNYESCPVIDVKKRDIIKPQLVLYEDGGVDLAHIQVPLEDYVAFFEGLANLFEGLMVLHNGSIAHMDIKPSNLVAKKESSGAYNVRYIDFGLSAKFDDIRAPKVSYVYWPFELRLLNKYYLEKDGKISDKEIGEYYQELDRVGRYFPSWIWRGSDGLPLITKNYIQMMIKSIKSGEIDKEDIIVATDVFGLGRAICEVYGRLTGHIYAGKNKVIVYGETAETRGFHELLKNKVSLPFYNFIELLVNPSMSIRPTPMQALTMYNKLLPLMRVYMKDFPARVERSVSVPKLRLKRAHVQGQGQAQVQVQGQGRWH